MKRAFALLGTVIAFALLTLTPAGAAPATPGPVTAWYDATYPTTTPAPPAPRVGVTADELEVSGATVSTSLLPVTSRAGPVTLTRTTALTAMRFTIPAGESPATLTLVLAPGLSTTTTTLSGRLPTGVTPMACPATSAFVAGGHQAFDRAPSYDCSGRTSIGELSADKTSIVFSDIAAVARGKTLSFVILPGTIGVDRLVFEAPAATSLSLLSFDTPPSFTSAGAPALPPVTAPLTSPFASPIDQPSSAVGVTRPVVAGRLAVPSPDPVVTQPAPLGATVSSGTTRAALTTRSVSDHPVQVEVLGGLVLLIAAAALMALTDKRRDQVTEWGIGRHRAARDGRAPAL